MSWLAFFSFCKTNRVLNLFEKILNSLVFSKLFYCSTVWSGSTRQKVQKLQQVQSFAARVLTGLRRFDHISPALNDLGWLPVNDLLIHRDLIIG